MPRSWVTLPPGYFREDMALASDPPQARKGVVTFGSAGNPYKYSAATLDAWARVLAAVPGSRFLFVRWEAAAPTFRRNVEAASLATASPPIGWSTPPSAAGTCPGTTRWTSRSTPSR